MSEESNANDSAVTWLSQKHVLRSVQAGGIVLFAVAIIGVVGSLYVLYQTNSDAIAKLFAGRIALTGIAMGTATVLVRLICGVTTSPWRILSVNRGETSGVLGAVIGMMVAGWVFESWNPPVEASAPKDLGKLIELSGPTLDGGQYDLAEHRGNVVLVDFWATWCGPCLAEMPNVRKVFEEYHDDGFEVVAVSLDDTRKELEEFLKEHEEPWPQIFFDEDGKRGFASPLAVQFDVQAIPRLLIIDRNGKLLADGVRGAEVETAVAKALGRSESWGNRVGEIGWVLTRRLTNGVINAPWWLFVASTLLLSVAGGILESAFVSAMRRPNTTTRSDTTTN